jgi:tetratricopeptide (TPR) repeat protein
MLATVGILQAALGDYDSALKTSLQADSIVSKADPQGYSRATLSARLSLAFAAKLTGQYGTAVEQARQAQTVAVRLAGPENDVTLIAERTLAIILGSIGSSEQALPIFERHLVLYEKREGDDGPNVATTLRFIGSSLDALGRREQAKTSIERALAILARRGDNPIESRPALSRLASIEEDLGQFTSAIEHQERVVQLARVEFEASHPVAISELSKLSRLYSRAGQDSKALTLHQHAVLAAEATQDPVVRMSAALNFAGHFARFGDRSAAIFFGKRAVAA